MVRDGDAIYVARPTALERIDAHTGERTNVAGPEWAQCPRDKSIVWMSSPFDWAFPALLVEGTTAYVAQTGCGLWSFDFATKTSHMLIDPSIAAKQALFDSGAPFPEGSIWNGKDGPQWNDPFGIAFTRDGDGLLACFSSFAHEPYPDSAGVDRVELWSLALDGTPRERLAFIPLDRKLEIGENFCSAIVPDVTSITIATDHALVRVDRATRTLTPIATGMKYGTVGLATDDADIYFVYRNAIVRVPRAGGDMTTLFSSSGDPHETVRVLSGLDGDYLYFNDGYTLKRMNKTDGSNVIEFAHGDKANWIMPRMVGISSDYVYYQRITNVDATSFLGTLFRARK
jgi:hypothetical protein